MHIRTSLFWQIIPSILYSLWWVCIAPFITRMRICLIYHLIIWSVKNHSCRPLLLYHLVCFRALHQFLCFFNCPFIFGLILPAYRSISISAVIRLCRVNALFIFNVSQLLLLLDHWAEQVNLVPLVQVLFAKKHSLLWIQPFLQTNLFADSLRLPPQRQAIVIHVQLLVLIAATAH